MRRFSLECGIPGEYSRRGSCLVRTARNGWFVGGPEKGVVPRDTSTLAAGFTDFTGFAMKR